MSSATAAHADSATQRNFNPSWIRSAFHGGGVNSSPRVSTNDEGENMETHLSQPVISKNRYGREEVLVLVPKTPRPPVGLSNCPFYVPDPRDPLALSQLSELEQRLQPNINSSKAMSSLTAAERINVIGQANATSPNPNGAAGPNSPQTKTAGNNGWTPVKSNTSWGRGTSQPTTPNANGRGGMARSMGRGAPPVAQADDTTSPYGKQFAYRGRGGLTTARGGSVTATNSRAQGLYDPRDPKDRPRNRLRSTSEEGDGADSAANNGTDGGWTRPGQFGRQNSNAWNKEETPWGNNDKENLAANALKSDSTNTMPEWMDDGEEPEKAEESAGGSFDDDGRYRQPQNDSLRYPSNPRDHNTSATGSAPSWRPTASQAELSSQSTSAQPSYGVASAYAQSSQAPGPAPGIPAPAAAAVTNTEFYYLDPTEKERGPFKRDQMITWFKMGYFSDTLKLRRSEDHHYKTLGELKQVNGTLTPFDYKEQQPQPAFPFPSGVPGPTATAGFGGNLFGPPVSRTGVWNDPLSSMYNASMFGPNFGAAFDAKHMEVEARRMEEARRLEMEKQAHRLEMEKQAHYRELVLSAQRQAEETERALREKEMAYRTREEEMKRLFEQERLRREMEQMELAQKVQLLEAEKIAREEEERRKRVEEQRKIDEERQRELAKQMEEERKRDEEKRKKEEEKMRKEAEALKKKEEEERKRRAEVAAEEHRKLLQKKAEEDAARIRAQQAAARAAEEEANRRAAAEVEKMFNTSEDAWASSPKQVSPTESLDGGWEKAPSKTTKKVAKNNGPAWTTASQNAPREKTLREIQEEEERQIAAEQKELARLRKEQESSNASMQSGMWAAASQRISWNQPGGNIAKAPSRPAWGGAGVEAKVVAPSPFWDGPSLAAANKPAAAPAAKKTAPAAQAKKAAASTPAKPAAAKNTKAPANSFTQWVVKRLKEISSTVDADVLSSFLESVENPNEVDDYVEGYLGSSKVVKEFVKEYLQKRSESRKRSDTDKDDLSSACKAGTGSGTIGKKKKNGKGQRLIVDGSCLGFRATGDPNRVNQGEIETVGLAQGQKR